MAAIDNDSKERLERFVNHQEKDEFTGEDIFLDLCRVLILMLAVFAILYGVWFN